MGTEQIKIPSRREMREAMLPKVGDVLQDKYHIVYVNNGKFRFTAVSSKENIPQVGNRFEDSGKIYEVSWIDCVRGRFTSVFRGFKDNPIADAPVEEERNELVKLI